MDSEVRDFVLGNNDCETLIEHIIGSLKFLIPHYKTEGKRYLTVAVGCRRTTPLGRYLEDQS